MKVKTVMIIMGWLLAVFYLAPVIDMYNCSFAAADTAEDVPVLMRFFGEGRSILSNLSVLQADLYFHSGVGHIEDHHMAEAVPGHDNEEGDVHESSFVENKRSGDNNILLRLAREIVLDEHIHLTDKNIKEIIPWLYAAAEIDPHNVLAYTLTSYYLAERMGKVKEAVVFLRKGLVKNPGSWEINAELGRICFENLKRPEIAVKYLEAARRLLAKSEHDKFQERYVLSLLAYSYEAMGRYSETLPIYMRLHALFPETQLFIRKIETLQKHSEES